MQIADQLKIQTTDREREREREMDVAEEHDIVIVGGGICGLATALALHRKGMSSIVLERAETLRTTGAAIFIPSNGWRALDHLGVASKLRQTAIPIQRLRNVSTDNTSLKETPIENEARCIKRSVLSETLANDLPIGTVRFGCHIIAVQMDPLTTLPILQLHNGTVIKAKVVIGCDGVNSVIANYIGLKPPKQSSTSGVRGFTTYPMGHGFSPEFVTMTKPRLSLGRIPIDHNLVFWFSSRQCTPQDSAISKEAQKIRSSVLESVKGFPKEIVEMIENSDVDSLTLNCHRYRAPWELLNARFRKGTVTVAGDAMHVMGPFLGQGGSVALEDAVVLARCLATQQRRAEDAIDRYVGERRMRLVQVSTKTYTTGTLFETQSVLVKLLCVVVMVVFFRDRLAITRYDCGRL